MKFHCEYCKELVDADKDKKCPSCGASYKDNKEYAKLLEERKKNQEEFKKHIKRTTKFAFIPIIVAPLLIVTIIVIGVVTQLNDRNFNNKNDEFDEFKNKVEENINNVENNINEKTKEKEVEPVYVNQEKSSADYKVKLEKYRLLEQTDDKEHDKLEVTLIVEKISDKFSAWGETIYCLINNVSQEYDHFDSDSSTYIKDKNVPLSKKMTYYVPKNTSSFDIKYGNIISFHIDIKND